MKASVILPVYNKAPWLRTCLESILSQTFGDFELLAVDDASTDDSVGVLRSISDPRLRIIELPRNVGPGLAAQHAMDEAHGAYLLRVDADDVLHPARFERQLRFLDVHPEVGVCGTQISLLHDPSILRKRPTHDAAARAELLFGVAVYQPTMALRRRVLQQHGIRYGDQWPRYGEDWMLQLELARVTAFANIDEPLVQYREGPQNISHGRDRGADLFFLFDHAFTAYGLERPTHGTLELHAMAVKYFEQPPDAQRVRAFKRHLDGLATWNDRSGYFDREAFRARLARAWDELLHHLPPHGAAVVWAYLRAGGRLDGARAWYLLRSLMPGAAHNTNAGR
jgi:glycosyltransferase involved in cell wall biosynthesis